MRILITGSNGQLGQSIQAYLPAHWHLIAADSSTLNLCDTRSVYTMIQKLRPDAIINAAAYTAVDQAECHRDLAFAINGRAVYHLAYAAKTIEAQFIHISTDYVFDGNSKIPYRESSIPNPQNVYGQSKLAGELLALPANPNSLIIRTSWLFSEYGKSNFVKSIIKTAQKQNELYVVDDQIGCPTYAVDLALAIIKLLQQPTLVRGILHYCGSPAVSRYEFAKAILQTVIQLNNTLSLPNINPISTNHCTRSAYRPAYSALDTNKIEHEFAIAPSDWNKALFTVSSRIHD